MQKKSLVLALSFIAILCIGITIGYYLILKTTTCPKNNIATNNNVAVSTTESLWDKLWATYTSPQGISFRYPRQIGALDRCGGGHDPYVAMKIMEDKDNNTVYAAPEYYYDYSALSDGSQDTSKACQKITNSLDQINGKGVPGTAYYSSGNVLGGLDIHVKDVKDKEEFKKFVKDVFGQECNINDQDIADNAYDYKIQGTGMEGNCPMNFMYKVLYDQKKNRAAIMSLGQDCTIDNGNYPTSVSNECYITEIAGSVQFN